MFFFFFLVCYVDCRCGKRWVGLGVTYLFFAICWSSYSRALMPVDLLASVREPFFSFFLPYLAYHLIRQIRSACVCVCVPATMLPDHCYGNNIKWKLFGSIGNMECGLAFMTPPMWSDASRVCTSQKKKTPFSRIDKQESGQTGQAARSPPVWALSKKRSLVLGCKIREYAGACFFFCLPPCVCLPCPMQS